MRNTVPRRYRDYLVASFSVTAYHPHYWFRCSASRLHTFPVSAC